MRRQSIHPHALEGVCASYNASDVRKRCRASKLPDHSSMRAHACLRARVPACIRAHRLHRRRQVCELRGACMSLPDELAARIPLAYVHFTAFLVDALLFLSPLALVRAAASSQTTATTPQNSRSASQTIHPQKSERTRGCPLSPDLQRTDPRRATPRRNETPKNQTNSCLGSAPSRSCWGR